MLIAARELMAWTPISFRRNQQGAARVCVEVRSPSMTGWQGKLTEGRMTMFEPDYLNELQSRYGAVAPHEQPPVAQVAENRDLRDLIEVMLARLHPDDVPVLITKLRNA